MKSLRAKLAIGFGGMLVILLVVSLLSIVVLTRYSRALEKVFRDNYDSVLYCNQMKDSLDELNTRAQRLVWQEGGDSGQVDEAAQIARFQKNLDLQIGNVNVPGEPELTEQLRALWQSYRNNYETFDLRQDNGRDLYRGTLLPQYQQAKRVAQQIADINMSNMVSVDGQVKRTLLAVRRTLLVLVLIGTVLAATLVGTVGATILRPLRTLTLSARQIETGNLDLDMPIRSRDEIGQLMEAFNAMASRLREFRRLDSDRLARTQQTTQLAIDSLPDAVVVAGPQGQIEISNRSAQLHFKIVPGSRVADLGLPWLSDIFSQVIGTAQPYQVEGYKAAIQLFENRREKFLLPRAVPMLDPAGNPIGVTIILVDVTALRHADELKSGLVSTVSHELRTPLTALRMAIILLRDERVGALGTKQRTLVKAAHDESERLYHIIDNLLNISRIESGRAQFDFQPVGPADLIASAIEELRETIDEKRMTVETIVPANLPQVFADPTFIGYALTNLISNALKFTPASGSIKITAEIIDGAIAISVADSGPGIPEKYVDRLFEKFFRIPRNEGPTGVGLGLAIAKDIVDAHGGRLTFRNRADGGAEFKFTIPLGERVPAPFAAAAS
jgi:NtrC-family two-component system sensor histidine kinase KinB